MWAMNKRATRIAARAVNLAIVVGVWNAYLARVVMKCIAVKNKEEVVGIYRRCWTVHVRYV